MDDGFPSLIVWTKRAVAVQLWALWIADPLQFANLICFTLEGFKEWDDDN